MKEYCRFCGAELLTEENKNHYKYCDVCGDKMIVQSVSETYNSQIQVKGDHSKSLE